MSAVELRAALDAAIAAERAAEHQDGLAAYVAARDDARARQRACVDEMAHRAAHFEVVSGAMGGLSDG